MGDTIQRPYVAWVRISDHSMLMTVQPRLYTVASDALVQTKHRNGGQ